MKYYKCRYVRKEPVLSKLLNIALMVLFLSLPGVLLADTETTQVALTDVPITWQMGMRTGTIIVLFLIIATLIATRKLPAMVALPIMAVGIGICAGIPIFDTEIDGKKTGGILSTILEGNSSQGTGMFMMTKAIVYTLLGGMFARFINDAKIAERLIKYAAEFGGEDPFLISLMMSAVTALVFTAIGGLPAMIMLGTVMFPILLSLGVSPTVCGCILCLAFPIGSALGPANWAITADLYGIAINVSVKYFLCWAILQAFVLLLFLTIEFLRMRRSTVTLSSIFRSITMILFVVAIIIFVGYFETFLGKCSCINQNILDKCVQFRHACFNVSQWAVSALLVFGIIHTQVSYFIHGENRTQWNLLTPILPLVFILMLNFNDAYGSAFICSLAYGFLTTPADRSIQRLGKTIMVGIGEIAAPVVLMMGIGMLVSAARHPITDQLLTPVLSHVIPDTRNAFIYVLFFTILAPFALYRGPLNEWGLGVGIARIFQKFMPAPATMGAIKAVTMLPDPTTTHNVWICGYLKLDINALLFKMLPYSYVLVIGSLIVSAYLFL